MKPPEILPPTKNRGFHQQLDGLLRTPGLKLPLLVSMLGGEDFLHEQQTRKGPVQQFDADGWIAEQESQEHMPQLPDEVFVVDAVILEPGEGDIQHGEGKGLEKRGVEPRIKSVMNVCWVSCKSRM